MGCKFLYNDSKKLIQNMNKSGALNGKTVAEDKQLIIVTKMHRMKTVLELTNGIKNIWLQPSSLSNVQNRLRPAGFMGCLAKGR